MRNFLVIFSILFCSLAWAGGTTFNTSSPSLTIGGRVFTDLSNLIILRCHTGGSATTKNCTFRQEGSTSGYQVPAGKTLNIWAYQWGCSNFTSLNAGSFQYGDNDIGVATNTSPTNSVAQSGISSIAAALCSAATSQNSSATDLWQIPATKFPAFQDGGTSTIDVTVYGYLQ